MPNNRRKTRIKLVPYPLGAEYRSGSQAKNRFLSGARFLDQSAILQRIVTINDYKEGDLIEIRYAGPSYATTRFSIPHKILAEKKASNPLLPNKNIEDLLP